MNSGNTKKEAIEALRKLSVRGLRATEQVWKGQGDEIKIDGKPAIFWVVEQAIGARKQDDRYRASALGVLSWLLNENLSTEVAHKGSTPLMEAAAEGDLACARRLLAANAKLSAASAMGNTPLHWAAIGGRPSMCKLLAAHGADLNKQNSDRHTPLHCAADRLRMNTITALHEAGANWDAVDAHGRTPLDVIEHRDTEKVHAKNWRNRPERDRLARETSNALPDIKPSRSRRL